jgi:SpoVK/Ycf46/Vps4 family AAA+-type ATPase
LKGGVILKIQESNTPKGIHSVQLLPTKALGELWDSIVVDQGMKDRLLSQAILNFTVRPKVSRTVLPLHGAILLTGAPGTGKTSLARGLANRIAESIPNKKFTLLEVDPHALGSSMMGKTQKAVSELFSQSIAETAMSGATIVLLDEVETLAADRSKMSLEANPIDVHRATDAVLVQLDALAEVHQNLLFLATSNFPQAVDRAFTSRCDLVIEVPLPEKDACEQILVSCLEGLGGTFSSIGLLPRVAGFSKAVDALVGLDGRAIRKVVANALANRKEVALNPQELTIADLVAAAKRAAAARATKGPHV